MPIEGSGARAVRRRARHLRERRRGLPEAIHGRPGTAGRGVVFVLLALLPVTFSKETTESFEYPKVILLQLGAIALAGLGATRLARRGLVPGDGRRLLAMLRDPVVVGILLVTVSACVSTATSISPLVSLLGAHESFAGLTTIAAYTTLFCATRALVEGPADARGLLLAPVMAASIAGMYGLVQLAGLDPLAWGRTSEFGGITRPFATMGHPNFLAAYLVMVLPLGLVVLREAALQRRRVMTGFLGLSTVVSLALIVASVSRGAWLALAVALVVLALGLPLVRERRGALTVTLAASGLLLIVMVIAALAGGRGGLLQAVADRTRHLFDMDSRWHIWAASLRLFRQHPVFGAGLDTFQVAFARERTVDYWLIEWNGSPTKAHNELLHVLATQGLLGGVAVLTMTIALAWSLLRALRRAEAVDRPWLLAIAAGVAAFCVQNLVSFTVVGCGALAVVLAAMASRLAADPHGAGSDGPSAAAARVGISTVLVLAIFLHNAPQGGFPERPAALVGAFLVLTALALGALAAWPMVRPGEPDARRPVAGTRVRLARWWAIAGVWLGAAGLAWIVVVQPLEANRAARRGIRLAAADSRTAIEWLVRAVQLDPRRDLYWAKLGSVTHARAAAVTDAGERARLLALARRAHERSIGLVPANAHNYANLGRVLGDLASAGRASPPEVWEAFDAALRIDPNNAYFYAQAADAAFAAGDAARARRYAEAGSARYPGFALTRAQLGQLALVEGRLDEAERVLHAALQADWHGARGARASAASNLAAVYLRGGRAVAALEAASRVLDEVPDHADARFNLGRALEMLGRLGEAAREYRRILVRTPDHSAAREALRSLGRP